jgi:hypothetical protein
MGAGAATDSGRLIESTEANYGPLRQEDGTMKRSIVTLAILCASMFSSGCLFLNRYDSDPNYKMKQLLNESEDMRQANEERHRFWMNNQPSCLSYDRLSGAIGP